jgi:hypothetical protein
MGIGVRNCPVTPEDPGLNNVLRITVIMRIWKTGAVKIERTSIGQCGRATPFCSCNHPGIGRRIERLCHCLASEPKAQAQRRASDGTTLLWMLITNTESPGAQCADMHGVDVQQPRQRKGTRCRRSLHWHVRSVEGADAKLINDLITQLAPWIDPDGTRKGRPGLGRP